MNLMTDAWIPAVRQDGTQCKISPWQICETENPVVGFNVPRADFNGAFYQYFIGLLQKEFAPEDDEAWIQSWEEPIAAQDFQERICSQQFKSCFELFNEEGPSFLQDLELREGDSKPAPISGLLIESPGGNALKNNTDLFVKRGGVNCLCGSCTAIALFTLQTNAPSGGSGHRVGLRGGGPLTSLALPNDSAMSLYHQLWLNVLPQEDFQPEDEKKDSIFPWMAKTRISDKAANNTQPEDVHSLQMYWGMPRRIRLVKSTRSGDCSLCGNSNEQLFDYYITNKHGVNYEGPWVHPLTPYSDEKKGEPPLTVKGKQGGLSYRDWLGLSLATTRNRKEMIPAKVVQRLQERANAYKEIRETGIRLWCFGFDMDNAKARCWYDSQIPFIKIGEKDRAVVIQLVSQLISLAEDTERLLQSKVKAAWFERPKDAKGDCSMIGRNFWKQTEESFRNHLDSLVDSAGRTNTLPPETAKKWVEFLSRTAVSQFDYWVLEGDLKEQCMKRIFTKRKELRLQIKKGKAFKEFWNLASLVKQDQIEQEVAS